MGVCRRGHRGVFWDIFVREKCTPGVVEDGVSGLENKSDMWRL